MTKGNPSQLTGLCEASVQEVLAIVNDATKAKRPSLPATSFEQKMAQVQQWVFNRALYAAVVLLVLAGLALIGQLDVLRGSILAAAVLSQLFGVLILITGIVSGVPFLWSLRRSIYGPFLEMVRISSMHDLAIISKFGECQEPALQYVLMQYKQERNGYERRTGMLNGSIEKMGIAPALAALVLLIWNLLKVGGPAPWATFFGPLLLAFMFLSMAAAQMTYKMDRVIALLELTLQLKKAR